MPYSFDTASGSEWTVENGRVTREFWADRDGLGFPIISEPFVMVRPPVVGERAVLRLKGQHVPSDGVVTTSPVTRIRHLAGCSHCGIGWEAAQFGPSAHEGFCPVALLGR